MNRVIADDVVNVALQQHMSVQRDVDLGQCGADVLLGVQVDPAELGLQLLRAHLGQVDVAAVGVGVVVLARGQLADQPDDLQARLLAVCGAGQHQRHQRLVDQHGVGLVDERHIGIRRHQIGDIGHQLVAQHVEPDLVDRGVGDVALVGFAALVGGGFGGDPADRQPHGLQQRAHPLRIAARQIVVDGDDVHIAAADRVPGRRDRTGQRLTLAGGHLDDVTGQHAQRAEQLHVERAQRGGAFGRFPGYCQKLRDVRRFGQVLEAQQLCGLAQLLIVELGGLLVELRRGAHPRHRAVLILVGAGAEQLPEPVADAAGGAGLGLRHTITVRGASGEV